MNNNKVLSRVAIAGRAVDLHIVTGTAVPQAEMRKQRKTRDGRTDGHAIIACAAIPNPTGLTMAMIQIFTLSLE